jgi:hypothetical protein
VIGSDISCAVAWKKGARVVYIDTTFNSASRAGFSLLRPPYVESVSPQFAQFGQTTRIIIKGRRLGESAADLSAVSIGDFDCTNIVWVSSMEVHCDTPKFTKKQLESLGFSRGSDGLSVCRRCLFSISQVSCVLTFSYGPTLRLALRSRSSACIKARCCSRSLLSLCSVHRPMRTSNFVQRHHTQTAQKRHAACTHASGGVDCH